MGQGVGSPVRWPFGQQAPIQQGFQGLQGIRLLQVGDLTHALERASPAQHSRRQQQRAGFLRMLFQSGLNDLTHTGRQRHPGHRADMLQGCGKVVGWLLPFDGGPRYLARSAFAAVPR